MNKCFFTMLISALAFADVAMSQTFYEVHYIDKDKDEFTGLMIYYNENNSKLRMISHDANDTNVYESAYTQLKEGKESSDDVGILAYTPTEKTFPSFIWIWEKDDASDMSPKPYVTYDVENAESWFQSDYFTEIGLKDMDEEYVSQFYDKDEPEYKLLIQGSANIKENEEIPAVEPENPTPEVVKTDKVNVEGDVKLYLMVLANTAVSDIGEACKVDLENVRSEFKGIAKSLKIGYEEILVSDNNYGKSQLQNAIEKLSPSKNDIVVFVYSGHGFRFQDQKDYYPMLDLTSTSYDDINQNYVALSDIYKAISAKQARLNIVLSDCCNSKISSMRPVKSNTLFSRASNNYDVTKLNNLFMKSQGNVLATAASPGEYSWCGSNGGFFLLSMIQSLREQISVLNTAAPSWDELIKKTIEGAKEKSTSSVGTQAQNGLKFTQVKSL